MLSYLRRMWRWLMAEKKKTKIGRSVHLNPRNALGRSLTEGLTREQKVALIKGMVAQGRTTGQQKVGEASGRKSGEKSTS